MSCITSALNRREGPPPTQISPLTELGYIYAQMGGYAGSAAVLQGSCSASVQARAAASPEGTGRMSFISKALSCRRSSSLPPGPMMPRPSGQPSTSATGRLTCSSALQGGCK